MIHSVVIYDQQFNMNEIIVLLLLSTYLIVIFAPKRFSVPITLILLLYSLFYGTFFDNLLGIQRINYYDINDKSTYNIYDALLYLAYGPFSYFFIYFYDKYQIRRMKTVFYLLGWSLFGVLFEYTVSRAGVFHYLNGYKPFYSFPIYLFVQITLVMFFHWLRKTENSIDCHNTTSK
ncbi:hypothetical protein LCL95_01470 [Bacillus timonensis]|nr:hypothetical protein [Bacillus timonensis]